ncbi:GGDEF domain-containing protein [Thiohalorhabdus denitrificans]|uniref:diguanylate cyclase n=1 Tax=Thiohalorhabdus denitrificans TaxID=381306 RepID=A0A1G5CCE6_9GAMM|nr:GGDEF domain-containing protein [Thiohalorhabdus denitrificans]SCY00103.1 diguanylate cyclase (GGDEF) domain-containing protein [Thiohalorhabdus denitrificans]
MPGEERNAGCGDCPACRDAGPPEACLEGILEGLGAGGLLTDRGRTIHWVSEALQDWWGLHPEHWLGRPLEALGAHPAIGPWIGPLLAGDAATPAGPVYCEVGGSWFRVTRNRGPIPRLEGDLLGVVDLTSEGRRLRRLERAAVRDDLTGLPNRRSFRERLGAAVDGSCRHGYPVSLAYLDLDDFKRVNDRLGHVSGDAVLRAVGETLAGFVRREDTAARLGGEEFAILFSHTAPETARAKAEEFRERLMRAALPGPEAAPGSVLTVSIGTAGGKLAGLGRREEALGECLLAAADRALYAAKAEGKNRVRMGVLPGPVRRPP